MFKFFICQVLYKVGVWVMFSDRFLSKVITIECDPFGGKLVTKLCYKYGDEIMFLCYKFMRPFDDWSDWEWELNERIAVLTHGNA